MLGIVDAIKFREAILSQKDKLQRQQSVPDKSSEPHELSDLVDSVKRIEALLEQAIAQTKG